MNIADLWFTVFVVLVIYIVMRCLITWASHAPYLDQEADETSSEDPANDF
jgi:hypothetical protein